MSEPKTRRNVLPQSSLDRIAAIRAQTGTPSDAEVVKRALRLYETLLKNEQPADDRPLLQMGEDLRPKIGRAHV